VIVAELSPEIEARSQSLWNELVEQCRNGPLPFAKPDPNDPKIIESLWHVRSSGNEAEDVMRGCMYGELLLHRAKNWRGGGDPAQAIAEICLAIVKQGNPSFVEFGFFVRLACCAMAGSLN
jgi:hypothetical protein